MPTNDLLHRMPLLAGHNFPTVRFFPASTGVLATYIASLFSKHYAPATLMTYMSALAYIHKLSGMPDPTQHFVIKKLLAGAQKPGKPDTRLPITPRVLCQIVDSTQFIASSAYLRYMLQSMFLLALHAFLRIGGNNGTFANQERICHSVGRYHHFSFTHSFGIVLF